MTKADLTEKISGLTGIAHKDAVIVVATVFDNVARALIAGDKVEIPGFGSFRTRQRKPRVGRNPKTGERVEVPAKKIPLFRPTEELNGLVSEETENAA